MEKKRKMGSGGRIDLAGGSGVWRKARYHRDRAAYMYSVAYLLIYRMDEERMANVAVDRAWEVSSRQTELAKKD